MFKKSLLLATLLMSSVSVWAAEHWVDVRSAEQFNEAHIDGAVNIPLKEIGSRINEITQNKNDTINLYCNSGNQSGKAETLLQKAGYKNAVNKGGIKDLAKEHNVISQ